MCKYISFLFLKKNPPAALMRQYTYVSLRSKEAAYKSNLLFI